MSTWGYRVFRTSDNGFAVFEVYISEEGRVHSRSRDPVCPVEDTVEELRARLEQILKATYDQVCEDVD